jgi:hypothetical protein
VKRLRRVKNGFEHRFVRNETAARYVDLSAEELEYDGTGWLSGLAMVCLGAAEMVFGGISIPATLGVDIVPAAFFIANGAVMVSAGANEMNNSL